MASRGRWRAWCLVGSPSPTPCPPVRTPPRPRRPTSPPNTARPESTSPSNSSSRTADTSIGPTDQLGPRDRDDTGRLLLTQPGTNEQKRRSGGRGGGICTFNVFSFYSRFFGFRLLLLDDVFVLLLFFGTCLMIVDTESSGFLFFCALGLHPPTRLGPRSTWKTSELTGTQAHFPKGTDDERIGITRYWTLLPLPPPPDLPLAFPALFHVTSVV